MNNNDEINSKAEHCILFFTKWPAPGQVKTRLGEHIGHRRAAELYRAFVHDLLQTLKALQCATVCCYDRYVSLQSYKRWLGPNHLYLAQTGSDLGERLSHAFTDSFAQGFDRVIAIGTDSPDIPESYLKQSLISLVDHDATIGPSRDGGYYLIGFSHRGFLTDAFQNISWSTDKVFAQTCARLEQHQRHTHILPGWHDIDTIEDLNQLRSRHSQGRFARSETMAVLNKKALQASVETVPDGSV